MTSAKRAILFGWGTRPLKPVETFSTNQGKNPSTSNTLFLNSQKAVWQILPRYKNLSINLRQRVKSIGLYAPDPNVAGLIKYAKPPRIFNRT